MKRMLMVIVLLANTCVKLSADLAGREYNRRIKTIEKMLDGEVPFDENYVVSQLQILRAGTTSADRVRRIERAYVRFGNRIARRAAPPVPEQPPAPQPPAPEQRPAPQSDVPVQSRDNRNAQQREAMMREELKGLLLYAESLVATADVALAVNQADNAREAAERALNAIEIIRSACVDHPEINPLFVAHALNRVSLLTEWINTNFIWR